MAIPKEVHIPRAARAHIHLDNGLISEWIGRAPVDGQPYAISSADAAEAQKRADELGIPLKDYRE